MNHVTDWIKLRAAGRARLFGLLVPLILVAAVACTPTQAEVLEGALRDVDTVNGQITIVTRDGKAVTLNIATEAPVEAQGAPLALETLEPGMSLEIEIEHHGHLVRHIRHLDDELEIEIEIEDHGHFLEIEVED